MTWQTAHQSNLGSTKNPKGMVIKSQRILSSSGSLRLFSRCESQRNCKKILHPFIISIGFKMEIVALAKPESIRILAVFVYGSSIETDSKRHHPILIRAVATNPTAFHYHDTGWLIGIIATACSNLCITWYIANMTWILISAHLLITGCAPLSFKVDPNLD